MFFAKFGQPRAIGKYEATVIHEIDGILLPLGKQHFARNDGNRIAEITKLIPTMIAIKRSDSDLRTMSPYPLP